MSYTLFGSPRSGSLAVEMAMAEMALPYSSENISLESNTQLGAHYQRINPHGKLPALRTPDGSILTESAAILLTLEERHRSKNLLPEPGSEERARALQIMMFVATEIYPLVEINDYPDRFAPRASQSDAIRERVREHWRTRWLHVESSVRGDPYLLDIGFSLVDIYIAVVSRWAQQEEWCKANLPKIERIVHAASSRPKSKPIWQKHYG